MLIDEFFYGTKKYHKKFSELFKPLTQCFGITTGAYIHIDQYGISEVNSNYRWVERFIEKDYVKQDPGIVHPDNISSGFTFVTTSDDQEYKSNMLHDAIHNFNFHHGFYYVEKNHSEFTLFYFATQKENNKIVNNMVNEVNLFKKLVRRLNAQIALEFKDILEHKADIYALKGDLCTQKKA